MAKYYIFCVNKVDRFNPYERIQSVGVQHPDGSRWLYTQQEAVQAIDNGAAFYVNVNNREVKVIVAVSQYGNRYLRTEADTVHYDNLLYLPGCN